MPFEFGNIVLVPFPFTDQTASKRRPAVIDSNHAYNIARPDLVIMAVTSQLRPVPALGEVWIGEWQQAGLLKPSAIKPVFAQSSSDSSSASSAHFSQQIRLRSRRRSPRQSDSNRYAVTSITKDPALINCSTCGTVVPHRHAGRRPGIHVFAKSSTARRGYRAFARHDAEGQVRRSS